MECFIHRRGFRRGKSCIAREIANHYNVNIVEADDIVQAVKAVTTAENFPALHYFETGADWMDLGVNGNVKWLISVKYGEHLSIACESLNIPVIKARPWDTALLRILEMGF